VKPNDDDGYYDYEDYDGDAMVTMMVVMMMITIIMMGVLIIIISAYVGFS
jgi:hypothetical protein